MKAVIQTSRSPIEVRLTAINREPVEPGRPLDPVEGSILNARFRLQERSPLLKTIKKRVCVASSVQPLKSVATGRAPPLEALNLQRAAKPSWKANSMYKTSHLELDPQTRQCTMYRNVYPKGGDANLEKPHENYKFRTLREGFALPRSRMVPPMYNGGFTPQIPATSYATS